MKISKKAGKTVQIVSISWPSATNLLNFFLNIREIIKWKVMMVISTKTIIAWSWKNNTCSMIGEALSWKEMANQFGINL